MEVVVTVSPAPVMVNVRAPADGTVMTNVAAPVELVDTVVVPPSVTPVDAIVSGIPASGTAELAASRSCTMTVIFAFTAALAGGCCVIAMFVAACAVNVTGFPVIAAPVTVAVSVLATRAPIVHDVTDASPAASVT